MKVVKYLKADWYLFVPNLSETNSDYKIVLYI